MILLCIVLCVALLVMYGCWANVSRDRRRWRNEADFWANQSLQAHQELHQLFMQVYGYPPPEPEEPDWDKSN